ncbi:MAG: SDR family NAD(P)-dependent oxidoreductase [Desulfuromonadales bacterium]
MQLTGNTILITGGATGIGLVLAQGLLERGNEVIICSRRHERLEAAQAANPGLHIRVCDVSDHNARISLVSWLADNFPSLNILINNAGVQHLYNFRDSHSNPAKPNEEIAINLGAPIHLTTLLLPLLESQTTAAVVNVSSGLGFTPLARVPVYCATKAALHSLTMSLRHQLRNTNVRVFEVIPPLVTSELGFPHRSEEVNSSAMPTEDAVAEIIAGLEKDIFELAIDRAKNLVSKREELFALMNAD